MVRTTTNATDLAELIIKRLDLGPAHLIGHSCSALYMAYQHPELVRTLVLGEPPVMSLLENNSKYSKDLYAIREECTSLGAEKVLEKQHHRWADFNRVLNVVDWHHRNGDRSDNKESNCVALCPNCHAIKTRRHQ